MNKTASISASKDGRTINVAIILENHSKGSNKEFDQFLSLLQDPLIENETLISCLRGLKDCMYCLGQEYEVLVGVLLKIDWTRKDATVFQEYRSFLLNLVSAHPVYVRACLRMLIKNFIPKLEKTGDEKGESVDDKQKAEHEQTFRKVHIIIQAISQIVPMLPSVLLPLLPEYFPYIGKATYLQECYARNLLHLTSYLPTQRAKVIELLVDRMAKLDVRSPRQEIEEADYKSSDEEEDEDNENAMDQDIFDMDDCAKVEGDSKSENEEMAHKEADRLDALLNLTLSYIHSVCYKNGDLDWEAAKKLYKELLLIFEKVILPTHASCHVQFVMFYIISFKQPLCDGFLDYLWKKVQDPNTQSIFRQASVAYIGSLLARAKYISASTVKACLELMCSWIHRYISQASDFTQADVKFHGPFYSVCQAVFYVFVFRHKELLELRNGYKHIQSLNFQTVVTSRLNPLKICLPIIAKTFASVTRMHQLAYCNTIIEHNNRSMLPVASSSHSGPNKLGKFNPLDSFFPFDPFLLKRSKSFITPLYQEFQGSVEEDEENMEDEDDFLPEVLSPASCSSSIPSGQTPVLSPDFLMYGVSPGFKST